MIELEETLLDDEEKKALVIGRFLGEKKQNDLYVWIEHHLEVPISNWLQYHQHWGNLGSVHSLPVYKEDTSVEVVYVIGLGKGSNPESYVDIGEQLAKYANQDRLNELVILWSSFTTTFKESPVATFEKLMKGYFASTHLSSLPTINLTFSDEEQSQPDEYEEVLVHAKQLAEKSLEYQTILERPTELMNGDEILNIADRIAKIANVQSDFFKKNDLESLGMGGILSSSIEMGQTPTFMKLDYQPNQMEKQQNIFLIGAGVINNKVERIRNNNYNIQFIYRDRLGALLALLVLEKICTKKLPIPMSVLCPITKDAVFSGGENVRLMNDEVFFNESAKKNMQAKVSDSISFAKQEKATTIVSLASFSSKLATMIGSGFAFVMSNDKILQQNWKLSKANVVQKSWLLPYDDHRLFQPGSELEELIQLGKMATPTPWFHIEILDSFLHKKEYKNPYSIHEEADFIVETLLEIQNQY